PEGVPRVGPDDGLEALDLLVPGDGLQVGEPRLVLSEGGGVLALLEARDGPVQRFADRLPGVDEGLRLLAGRVVLEDGSEAVPHGFTDREHLVALGDVVSHAAAPSLSLGGSAVLLIVAHYRRACRTIPRASSTLSATPADAPAARSRSICTRCLVDVRARAAGALSPGRRNFASMANMRPLTHPIRSGTPASWYGPPCTLISQTSGYSSRIP